MIPDISVVMPVFNGQKYLNEAIESILNQTYQNFEFIIIDDGSSDNSKEIIQSYKDKRIRLLEQKNSGVAIALNNAIKESIAALIARMDADDIAVSERLEVQISFLTENPGYILVGSNANVIDIDGAFIYRSELPVTWEEISLKIPDPSFFHSSVMFRKSSFFTAGGYPEQISQFNCFEDSVLWNKMKDVGMMANIEQPLIHYRLTPGAATARSDKETAVLKKIYREIITENSFSEENISSLMNIKNNANTAERESAYYIHLAKKYLWNNYQPVSARKNIFKALKIRPFRLDPFLLLFLSFFPRQFLLGIYKLNKS